MDIDTNKTTWNQYDWTDRGNEWSSPWGGVNMQWYGTILPRIHPFVPATTILEIAPGFGRWTEYLKELCSNLILVDLSAVCIEACQKRFESCSHISYFVNDGKSLDFISDESIDFAFSFDSLVHVEDKAIEAYINDLSKKIKPDGICFIHHSNLGEYFKTFSLMNKIPQSARETIERLGILDSTRARAWSMTATKFQSYCESANMVCISQEIINWRSRKLIDCISILAKKDSKWGARKRIMRNGDFMTEAKYLSKLAELYGNYSQKSESPSK